MQFHKVLHWAVIVQAPVDDSFSLPEPRPPSYKCAHMPLRHISQLIDWPNPGRYTGARDTGRTLPSKPEPCAPLGEAPENWAPPAHSAFEKGKSNPNGRWRDYDYKDLLKRDKLSLDLLWIKDQSITDVDSLPPPDVIAAEIADDLKDAQKQFENIAARLARSISASQLAK